MRAGHEHVQEVRRHRALQKLHRIDNNEYDDDDDDDDDDDGSTVFAAAGLSSQAQQFQAFSKTMLGGVMMPRVVDGAMTELWSPNRALAQVCAALCPGGGGVQ